MRLMVVEQGIHRGFPHAEGHDVPGDDDLAGKGARRYGSTQRWSMVSISWGGPGSISTWMPPASKAQPGGGAHGVVEHGAAPPAAGPAGRCCPAWAHGGRTRRRSECPPECPGGAPGGLSKGGADGLLGQIVIGGAQSAGGDEDVRPAAGDVQRLFQTLGGLSPTTVCQWTSIPRAERLWERTGRWCLRCCPKAAPCPRR